MRFFLPIVLFRWCPVAWVLVLPQATRAQAPAGPRPWRWVPSIGLDNRNPLNANAAVRVIGLNVGAAPRGAHYRLGLTAYTLRRDYSQYYTYQGRGKNQKIKDTYSPSLSLLYFTPNYTYTFLRHRWVELSVPVDVGLGRSHYSVADENGRIVTDQRQAFVPAEIGLGVLLKPTRWVGLSAGLGYRVSLTAMDYEDDFNGWYYSYRLVVFLGPCWHDFRGYLRRQQALPPSPEVPQQ